MLIVKCQILLTIIQCLIYIYLYLYFEDKQTKK